MIPLSATPPGGQPTNPILSMTPPKVLLIDRDPDSVKIYSLILRHSGMTVFHAHDPELGVRIACEANPDLVVAELFFPQQATGFLQKLMKNDGSRGMPLIVLDSAAAIRSQASRLEGVRRLTKPCAPSRLLLEVQRMLETRSAAPPPPLA